MKTNLRRQHYKIHEPRPRYKRQLLFVVPCFVIVVGAIAYVQVKYAVINPTPPYSLAQNNEIPASTQGWQDRLYTPTELVLLDSKWFIVDCWHHRVLWSYELDKPISQWQTMDSDLAGPHSVAYDGSHYAVEDTGRHALVIYTFNGQAFQRTQHIEGVGLRPHRIRYDERSRSFFVVGSASRTITQIMGNNAGAYHVIKQTRLDGLGDYTRSFSIIDDRFYFATDYKIIVTDRQFHTISTYDLPSDFTGPNDISRIGNKYVITATPISSEKSAAIGRVDSLSEIPTMKNELRDKDFIGTPYYITPYGEGRYIIPEITQYSRLAIYDSNLSRIRTLFDFGAPNSQDIERYNWLPK